MTDTTLRTPQPRRLLHPVLGYVFALVMGAMAVNVAWALGAAKDGFGALIAGMLGLWFGMFAAIVVATRARRLRDVAEFVGLRFRLRDMAIGLPLGVAAQLVVVPLVYLPLRAFGDLDIDDAARETTDLAVGWRIPILVAALVAGAPLIEEMFFRGLLQGALMQRLGTLIGVLATAAVFASIHFQIVQLPGLLIAALTFGILAARYHRLGPAVWAHVGFNGATVAVLLLLG